MTELSSLLDPFATSHVAVIGDVMLDHFLVGHVDRISPEAPVPVVRYARDEYRLGGAGNVAANLIALGARASLLGLCGDDESARALRTALEAAGLPADGLVTDASRVTTRKMRVVTMRNQQVARVDHEDDSEVSGAVRDAVIAGIERAGAERRRARVVRLSERRGDAGRHPRRGAGRRDAARATARRSESADRPIAIAASTIITPNHHEAEQMTQIAIRTPDDARRAARRLHEQTGASVLITWGEHGMWVCDASTTPFVEEALPAQAREVADVTGAGDTVIATLALGLAAGARLADAARIANVAAGLVVARFGPATVTRAELAAALAALPQA